ncbi:SIP domain-containing protein [Acinetobacter sp. 194]|uniref:siderophore-interacting protein n=1 Tax=Acinetobacter shaoyimingii TaxID=2715164 RepID=UPI00140AF9C3|nr:siderophore-interacting protein [Acinetobacter shaoyimingii]NHB57851.1 SIP domain-containing protein [Acinetobacter shaoyimingii]
MKHFTTIKDQDRKLDIMDHVNQDHHKELLIIAQTYGQNNAIHDAMIADIYEEGILLHTQQPSSSSKQELFIEFELKGDLEEQILYFAYNSFAKQKIEFSNNAKQFFEVIAKSQVSPNITRLTIKSQAPLPEYYAGYAYGFILKVLEKAPVIQTNKSNKSGVLKNLFDRGFLWAMKHLSTQKRQKLMENMNKDVRLYTLRKSFAHGSNTDGLHLGYVDVFTHGSSPGSRWVQQLQTGSLISSRTETDDKHEHLHQGQAVLIADETAFPALAGILDFWKNPIPPIVILLCADAADFAYFDDFKFPDQTNIKKITAAVEEQGQQSIALLKSFPQLEQVWGALENNAAKQVRHYFRNERKLAGKNNHIKGYWRLDKAH